jgi:hypothetical protein
MPDEYYKHSGARPRFEEPEEELWDFPLEEIAEPKPAAEAQLPPEAQALIAQPRLENQYTVEDLRQFSQYLNKESASRYKAIVLSAWNDKFRSPHYEVGLVQIVNGDHRNGVVRALRVSPLHVKFVLLEDAFFQYLYTRRRPRTGARAKLT